MQPELHGLPPFCAARRQLAEHFATVDYKLNAGRKALKIRENRARHVAPRFFAAAIEPVNHPARHTIIGARHRRHNRNIAPKQAWVNPDANGTRNFRSLR